MHVLESLLKALSGWMRALHSSLSPFSCSCSLSSTPFAVVESSQGTGEDLFSSGLGFFLSFTASCAGVRGGLKAGLLWYKRQNEISLMLKSYTNRGCGDDERRLESSWSIHLLAGVYASDLWSTIGKLPLIMTHISHNLKRIFSHDFTNSYISSPNLILRFPWNLQCIFLDNAAWSPTLFLLLLFLTLLTFTLAPPSGQKLHFTRTLRYKCWPHPCFAEDGSIPVWTASWAFHCD